MLRIPISCESQVIGTGLRALSGCATLINGTTENVRLSSTPDGAQVTVDGGRIVTTPAMIELSRGDQHSLLFHKDGYIDQTERLAPTESGWVWGNILLGGIAGAIADKNSGAAKKLSRDTLSVVLVAQTSDKTTASLSEPTTGQLTSSASHANQTDTNATEIPPALPNAHASPAASTKPMQPTLRSN